MIIREYYCDECEKGVLIDATERPTVLLPTNDPHADCPECLAEMEFIDERHH